MMMATHEDYFCITGLLCKHYSDVIMSMIASQITGVSIVYSTIYSGAHQRKHQSSVSLAFVRGIHRSPSQWRENCFHLIMSSWKLPARWIHYMENINSLSPGRYGSNFNSIIFKNTLYRMVAWALTVKLFSGKRYRTSLMESQLWFR